jgi:hypothetical protein
VPCGHACAALRSLSAAIALALAGACGVSAGERFGSPGVEPGGVRIAVPHPPRVLDPARVRTFEDKVLSRALFVPLVVVDTDGAHPGLATTWEVLDNERTLRFHLEPGARFTDGAPLAAHDVVWSWQRALKRSTSAADPSALGVVKHGTELVHGTLLRVSQSGAVVDKAPFAVFEAPRGSRAREDADARSLHGGALGSSVAARTLPAGAPVRVVDTNARISCCGAHTALLEQPVETSGALAVLAPGDIGMVLAVEETGGERWLRLRAPSGAAGWARAKALALAVPPVSLRRVVERGEGSLALLAGPDDSAPVRDRLQDDDTVELIERGLEFSLVASARTGRSGWIRANLLDDVVGERWRFLVAPEDGALASGWLEANDLVLDPGLLAARALDATTLEVDLVAPVSDALRAFSSPTLAPVPARLVDELGFAWAEPERIVTSGPFSIASFSSSRVMLVASPSSFEHARVLLERAEIVVEPEPLHALHLYRAGRVDALLDGLLPADLFPVLSRARDFVGDGKSGALIAPEVHALDPLIGDLRRVTVDEGAP